ncbi:MAG TPA: TetR/AcrR family transcriptional regulator [Steroidobacteraceae bacterium]|jgi:AcrR family transcriptional regulator|nr:TetR/AcrR family transcriptional regulator [Steroidobacteraceae bacterium]
MSAQAAHARATRNTRTEPALLGALLSLIEEKPVEQITIRELAARAGIGYATFFRHFPDIESLLARLAEREMSDLLAMTLPILITVDRRSSTQALCAYVWEHSKLWSTLLTGGAASTLKEVFVRQAQQATVQPARRQPWLPGDLSVVFPAVATVEILAWWLKQREPPSVKRMAEVLERLVVTPSMAHE